MEALNMLLEEREEAVLRKELYMARITMSYNRIVYHNPLKQGDLVLISIETMVSIMEI